MSRCEASAASGRRELAQLLHANGVIIVYDRRGWPLRKVHNRSEGQHRQDYETPVGNDVSEGGLNPQAWHTCEFQVSMRPIVPYASPSPPTRSLNLSQH
jgi:hypothetical protein